MTVRYLLGNIYNSVIFYIPVLAYHLFGRYRTIQCVAYRNCHLILNTVAWDILMFGLS
jgi:hypothetical protein